MRDTSLALEAVSQYAQEHAEVTPLEERWGRSDAIRAALDTLSPRERLAVELFFGLTGEEMTQRDIGKMMNLSANRVSQLCKDAVRKLRKSDAGIGLRLYAAEEMRRIEEARRRREAERAAWEKTQAEARAEMLKQAKAGKWPTGTPLPRPEPVKMYEPNWVFASTGTCIPPKPPPPPRSTFMPAGEWRGQRWRYRLPKLEANEREESSLYPMTQTLPAGYAWTALNARVAVLRRTQESGVQTLGYVAVERIEWDGSEVWRACVAERAELGQDMFVGTPNATTSQVTAMQIVELLCYRENGRV